MYLTDEIFKTTDAAVANHPYHSPMDHNNNNSPHSPEHLGKRKRGAAGDEYTANTVPLKNIKILPTHLDPFDYYPPPPYTPTADPTTLCPSPPRRKALLPRLPAQQPRRNATTYHAPAVRHQRPPPETHHNHNHNHSNHRHVPVSRPPAPTRRPTTAEDLAPCHCCHRAPRQKRELDGYSACAACGARTCYICMRVCERRVGCCRGGSNDDADKRGGRSYGDDGDGDGDNGGGRRKICRECCVESGPEGETWCFDCVAVGEAGGAAEGGVHEGEGMVMG